MTIIKDLIGIVAGIQCPECLKAATSGASVLKVVAGHIIIDTPTGRAHACSMHGQEALAK
jgi:hypothetical protein